MRQTCGVYEAMWLARLHASSAHALYLHIPFCMRKCAYCDFASATTRRDDPLMAQYVQALIAEIDALASAGLLSQVETAYIGGGTPSMLGASLLKELVQAVRAAAPRLRELTCEANPDSLSDEVLQALVASGVTRLSMGVQSLNDQELTELGRLHDAESAADRVRAAVASGLDVSCDLMCATPTQTDESWLRTLEQVIGLNVDHVSVYPLQIEENTPFGQRWADGEPAFNDPEVQASRMELAARELERAGYVRYEVASYARGDKACRHNQAYWTGRPYLGLGAGASSMLTREAYQRLRTVYPQLPELDDDVARIRLAMTSGACEIAQGKREERAFDLELLDEAQAAAEDLMLGMRMSAGANPGLVGHARAVLGEHALDTAVAACVKRGLATWDGTRLVPTHEGWLLGNELYGTLWDLAPGEVRTVEVFGA